MSNVGVLASLATNLRDRKKRIRSIVKDKYLPFCGIIVKIGPVNLEVINLQEIIENKYKERN